jgi:hypothetical protein
LAPKLIAEYRKEHPAAAFDIESIAMATVWRNRRRLCDLAEHPGAIKEEQELARPAQLNYMITLLALTVLPSWLTAVIRQQSDERPVRDIFTGTIKTGRTSGETMRRSSYISATPFPARIGLSERRWKRNPTRRQQDFHELRWHRQASQPTLMESATQD